MSYVGNNVHSTVSSDVVNPYLAIEAVTLPDVWMENQTTWSVTSAISTDHTTSYPAYNILQATFIGLCLTLVISMTIGGNLLVLLAVFVNSHLRSTTNYFIVNLAVADLLLGIAVLPFSASLEIINFWPFGNLFCDIWAAVDVLCCTASIMSLCVISIDRYIGVTRPLQHCTIVTPRRAGYIIILIWVLATLISVAPLFGWKEADSNKPGVCELTKELGYVLFSVSGSFYIPLIIILVVYFRVYREALKQSQFLATGLKTERSNSSSEVTLRIHTYQSNQSSSSSDPSENSSRKQHSRLTMAGKIARFRREKKAAKTLGIVVGVFILCWFPFFFALPLESLFDHDIPDWLFKIIFWLGYCNSMMNPIIYACSSREFKRAFSRIIHCNLRRQRRSFLQKQNELQQKKNEILKAAAVPSSSRSPNRSLAPTCPHIKREKSRQVTRADCRRSFRRLASIISCVTPKQSQCTKKKSIVTSTPSSSQFIPICSTRFANEDESPIASLKLIRQKQADRVTSYVSSEEDDGLSVDLQVMNDQTQSTLSPSSLSECSPGSGIQATQIKRLSSPIADLLAQDSDISPNSVHIQENDKTDLITSPTCIASKTMDNERACPNDISVPHNTNEMMWL